MASYAYIYFLYRRNLLQEIQLQYASLTLLKKECYQKQTRKAQSESNCLFRTHMQISSQFRKPSSPLKQTHPTYITSSPCVPIGCTRQEVGSLHSLKTILDSQQQTYHRLLIHTTHNIKWSRYTLTTLTALNISPLQPFLYLLETAHPRTTKQLTQTYNSAYSTSQTYHTQFSPEM